MLGNQPITGFVPTTQGERARAFYGDTLGLRFVEETPAAIVFEAANATVRLAKVERLDPAPYTVLGWVTDDIAAVVAGLADRGVAFERFAGLEQDALGIWTSPGGARVAWLRDPDGNLLSLTQF